MQKGILKIQFTKKIVNNLLLFVFSLSVWVNSLTMFMWETYYNGAFKIPLTALKYAGFAALAVLFASNSKNFKIKPIGIIEFIVAFFLIAKILIFITYKATPFLKSYWIIPFYVFFLMQLGEREKRLILKFLVCLFIIFSMPSIIYWIFIKLGIDLPFSILYSDQELKVNAHVYYQHYPMALIFNQWGFLRPCGIFDEPGFIGTNAAMFFAILLQKGINKKNIKILFGLLLVGGLSTSLAAVVLFIIAIGVYAFIQKFYKALGAVILIFICFFIFMKIDFKNEILNNYQERLTITNGALEGNNRESEIFKQAFEEILEDDPITLLFGYGYDTKSELLPTDGSCSYRTFIYEYGLIGFAFLVLLLIMIFLHSYKSKYSLIPLCVFFASLYQRPYIIMPLYISIFIVGFSAIERKEKCSKKFIRRRN